MEKTKQEQIEALELIKQAAVDCLETLTNIQQLTEPGIMKATRVNTILEKQDGRAYRQSTEDEIKYYKDVILSLDMKIEELRNGP